MNTKAFTEQPLLDITEETPNRNYPNGPRPIAELMTDASIDQMVALDCDLKVVAWNRACELATGIAREEALGRPFLSLAPGAAAFPMVADALNHALQGLQSFLPTEKAAYRGGYHEHHFIPLRSGGESGPVAGVLIIIHDVAHRVKAEQELKRLNRELEQKARELQEKNSELAQFNWIASHDLKEPLRKIYTFIEMVATREGTKLTDAARSNLRRAQSAAQRMGLLTDDIATFTQVAAPSETLAEADLQALLDAAVEKLQRTIENTGAVLEHDPLPRHLTGYPQMLALLLQHLLGNALKFHAPGAQPRVRIGYEKVAGADAPGLNPDAEYHCISVKDNGIGIAPEYHQKIFGLFQRLHGAESNYRGTGMGLPVCKKVADAHGGIITVESEEGAGATFRCYLCDLKGLGASA